MRERETAHRPLMFIHQPEEHLPKTMMQYAYSSLRDQVTHTHTHTEHEEEHLDPSPTTQQTKDKLENVSAATDEQTKTDSIKEEVVHDTKEKKQKEKKFADLTIEEKVQYCISTSPHIPHIMCSIKTETTTTVGVIRSFEEGIIHVTSKNNRTPKKIRVEEITHIRMVGF